MSDLRVDYAVLASSQLIMDRIKSRLDGLEHEVSFMDGVWGHAAIQEALHEFASNWGYRRSVMSTGLGELGSMCGSVLDAFKQADSKLASELEAAFRGTP